MIALAVASPTISDIKVTPFDASRFGQGVRLEWLDEAGDRKSATRCGLTAKRILSDLRVATTMGETHRRTFLVGFIRGLCDDGGLDT